MARRDLLHILGAAKLSGREASLYLAGLELQSAPASSYAKRTSLNRITAYNTLEELSKRGIFAVVRKKQGKFYSPIEPEFLVLEAQKSASSLERLLPELRSMRGAQHRKPMVRFFEGWEGVRRVYEDTLTAESELLNFANSAIVRAHWKDYDQEYVAQRVQRGIYLRGIAPDDEAGRKVHGEDRERLREIRLVPADEFNFDNEINIYDHKVAIVSFGTQPKDLFGIIIESKEVSETQKQIFEMAWRYAGMVQNMEPHGPMPVAPPGAPAEPRTVQRSCSGAWVKGTEAPTVQAVLELNKKG